MTEPSVVIGQGSVARLTRKNTRLKQLLSKYKGIRSIQHALLQLSELASSVTDMTLFYPAIHKVIGSLFQAENFFIVLHNCQSNELELQYFSDQFDQNTVPYLEPQTLASGLTGYVFKTGKSLLCNKSLYEEMIQQDRINAIGSPAQSWMGVPITRGNNTIGVLAVQSYDKSGEYSEYHLDIIEFIATHLVTAINRIKSRELLERDVKQRTMDLSKVNNSLQQEIKDRQRAETLQSALFEISELSATTSNMDDLYTQCHRILSSLLYADNCYIALLSDDNQYLSFPYHVDQYERIAKDRPLGSGYSEYVMKTGEAIIIDKDKAKSLVEEAKFHNKLASTSSHPVKPSTSWLGAPLIVDGNVIGAIAIQAYNHYYTYENKDLEIVKFISHHIAVAIHRKLITEELISGKELLENKVLERTQELRQSNLFLRLQVEERKKVEEKLYFEAHHDGLTGLPNRTMFNQRLKQALIQKKRHTNHNFAVLFIDLDRFKKINDSLGHHAGDQFLIEVSIRISSCIRDNDILARIGGDEFVILLDMLANIEDAEEIAQRIIETVAKPFLIDNQQVYSGASIGIAECVNHYTDFDEIMRDADAAMYQAKNIGRGRYVLFDDSMRQQLLDELNLEQALHTAVKNQDFYCKFDHLLNIESNDIVGYQGEIFWRHCTLGETPLSDVIELAESSGLLNEIDQLALEQTCELMTTGGLSKAALVCLNLSPTCLTQPKVITEIVKLLNTKEVAPQRLCLQFEEDALLKIGEKAQHGLKMFKRAGLKIALQGFGSGTTSLTCVSQYSFDFVKLDGKFVKSLFGNHKSQAVLQTIVILSQGLGFHLIAEDINTEALFNLVKQHGCLFAQGKYIEQLSEPQDDHLDQTA